MTTAKLLSTRLYDFAQALVDRPALPPVAVTLTASQVAALIDHTLLKPEASAAQIDQLCAEAGEQHFATVCVNPTWVQRCAQRLAGSGVKVCTVIGFPLGANLSRSKASEASAAIRLGANEVDMVINVGRLKSQEYSHVRSDIAGVVRAAHGRGALAKVIIETALLTDAEKVFACLLAQEAGADFVKTSTGFSGGGATVADIALMRQVVGGQAAGTGLGIKASGGIRTALDAQQLLAAGATRLGASAGLRIVQEWPASTPAVSATPAAGPGENY
jgi:deoxyribose-phosphate aldolase